MGSSSIGLLLFLVLFAWSLPSAHAAFELIDDRGRRILLKDDGTWQYVEAANSAASAAKGAEAKPALPQADLEMTRRTPTRSGCQYDFVLRNTLPYEIRSFVPEFAAVRKSGVVYTAQTLSFSSIKPGDSRRESLRIDGITCTDIDRLRVLGGDRCEMGELGRFSEAKGECLARVHVVPTDVARFEKEPRPVPPEPAASAAPKTE